MSNLENKVAMITGGTGALGKAVTRAFLDAGASVVVIYHTAANRAELLSFLGGEHERLTSLSADITQEDQVKDFAQKVFDQFGRIDILAHLAGGYIGDIPVAQMEETTWDYMMALNLKSTFFCCKAALAHMLDQEYGKIVTVGARGGVAPFPGGAAYAVSKAGVHALTQAIASEVRGKNININAVLPSTIDSPANRQAMPQANFSEWVKPDDLAKVILFLASDAANEINGALIPV
jgi:NAD(P)-dependent dehydrogenase (short-subunit alcohol dehydrogenase family)